MAADNQLDNARTRVVESGAPLALAIGTLLGRYRIEGVLGQGGFGITYRATDTALNRAVAIKEYLPSDVAIRIDGTTVIPRSRTDAEDYDWGLKRFLDEAKTLAQHEAVPNVVRVYDFVEANGTAYMVMALVEGDNLSAILRQRGTLNEAELRGIVLPLLDGLEQLHEAGLIHRDIKPANIIIRGGRTPTLIDFGAAREGLGRKSRSVTSILTPGYAPFEQYGSAGDQGPWTDIYALAATLYHGIAGKAPPDSVDRIRRDPMVPAVQVGAGKYSEDFLAAIDAGLKVDERERPQNAGEWRQLFGSVQPGAFVPAGQPITTPQPATQQPVSHAPISQPVSQQPVSQPISQQPVSQAPVSQPAPSVRPSIEPPPPPSILAAPPAARASRKMLMVAGAAVLLIGGGVAVALTMSVSPQTAQPDQASVQLAEAEKKRAAELERKLAEEAESRKKLEAQVAEAEAKRKAEEEAGRKAAEEARMKAEAEAREKAEAENRRRIEEDTRKKVEAEYKAKAEEEARKRQAEDETKRKADEAKKKAEDDAKKKAEDEARKKADDARAKVEQKPAANPQVAAAPAPADPAAYVAQHWATSLRPKIEAALRQRGVVTDTLTGAAVRFEQINSYRVVSVTTAQIVVAVTYRNTRAVAGSFGNMAITPSDIVETAIFLNQPPEFPLVSVSGAARPSAQPQATAPTTQSQVAAAPAQGPADPAAYVAQHWPVMKPKVEAALKQRGAVTDSVSGVAMRFDQIYGSYRIVQVTAAQVVLSVTYRNVRAIPGGGNMTGTSQDVTETATFTNQPPDFPLVSLQSAAARTLAEPTAAAPSGDSAAYVAQHWPILKANAEAFMTKKGSITHAQSGFSLRYSSIDNSYKVVSVTPTNITLSIVMYLFAGGGGSPTYQATAVFQNQSPGFPVVRID